MKRAVSGATSWCYLCGLPIPDDIVHPKHALFGTIDHVVPLSKGGTNSLGNRKASHRMCNGAKSDRMLSDVNRDFLHKQIIMALGQRGIKLTAKALNKARGRIERIS